MKMVIVGQGPFGEKVTEALIQKGEDVTGLFCPPDKRGEGMRALAEKSGIALFRPALMKAPEVFDAFSSLRPELAVLAFVTDIIPGRLLAVPSVGTICYHPSLLPRHRGASAVNWALIQGDTRTGLTIFWADEGIDTGPILLQKEVEVRPDDTAGSLYFDRLFPMGIEAIVEAVDLIRRGKAPRIAQDDSKATYEPPCDDKVAAVDFAKSANEVYNLVRGCDPQPGAYAWLRGQKARLYNASMALQAVERPPGEILSIEEGGLIIALKGGIMRLRKFRVGQGEKVGSTEFARLTGVKPGDRLGG